MGAGKTQVGRLVARRLGVPFVDTDKVLSVRHGTIPALFEQRGEEGFRELERDVVLEQLAAAELGARVVALGGGAVTIDDVREALKRLRTSSGSTPRRESCSVVCGRARGRWRATKPGSPSSTMSAALCTSKWRRPRSERRRGTPGLVADMVLAAVAA